MMNGRISLDLYFRYSERINLVVRPQFKGTFGSIFHDDYHVGQQYYSGGLAFGLQYSIY